MYTDNADPPGLESFLAMLSAIFAIERETRFKKKGKQRSETVYGITSLGVEQVDAEK